MSRLLGVADGVRDEEVIVTRRGISKAERTHTRINLLLARVGSLDVARIRLVLERVESRLPSIRRRVHHLAYDETVETLGRAWYSLLGDVVRAAACFRFCAVRANRCRRMVHRAHWLHAVLGDAEKARVHRDILQAEEFAMTTPEWCACSACWRWTGDAERARACLGRAEEVAQSVEDFAECARTVDTSNPRKAIADTRRYGGRAETLASSVEEWLTCAWMYTASYSQCDQSSVVRCLRKARCLATTAEHWVRCAEYARWLGGHSADRFALHCMKHAEELAETPDDLQSIAVWWLFLLHGRDAMDGDFAEDALKAFRSGYAGAIAALEALEGKEAVEMLCAVAFLAMPWNTEEGLRMMLKAEAMAGTSDEWRECAKGWRSMDVEDGAEHARTCMRRARLAARRG